MNYIWIHRWEDFQHYAPERDRPPAWIKAYPKQLWDERYLRLSDRPRALLVDLRYLFALFMMQLPYDQHMITMKRGVRTYCADLEALEQAGFIDILSREALDQRLEEFYSSRARAKKENKKEKPPTPFRMNGKDPKPTGWRMVRGSHGITYVPDKEGVDVKPAWYG